MFLYEENHTLKLPFLLRFIFAKPLETKTLKREPNKSLKNRVLDERLH